MMFSPLSPKSAFRTALLSGAFAICGLATAPLGAAEHDSVRSTEVLGTAFRITLSSGRVLHGTELAGATLSVVLPGENAPRRLRLDRIVTDSSDPAREVLLHRASVLDDAGAASELCDPDAQGERWMFPLRGQWDADGHFISHAGFTLTCSGGAQGKCVRFGYKPWTTHSDGTDLADYHRACVKLVRADYCGDQGTTRNGMPIDIYDRLGIQRRAEGAGSQSISFEAAWGPAGALCVAHTRVPDNMTVDGLRRSCPRLQDRLGPSCTAEAAEAGQLGPALMFNRSP